jgi:hypothetical protein
VSWRGARGPFALALLIAGITRLAFPFDGLYGQDAFAYFGFARAIWPHLRDGAPLPVLFWPRGYPAAVAMLLPFARGGPAAGQLVSALACAWTAAASFLLVGELLEDTEGETLGRVGNIVAGVCVAASGIALRAGQVVMADGLAVALAATALWCAARFARSGRGVWLVLCAVAVAWGAVTRWQIGLIAVPIAFVVIPAHRCDRRWWIAALAAGLLVLVPQLLAARSVPSSLAAHEWLRRWNPLNAFRRDFLTSEGHARYRLPVGLFYLARLGWPDALFPTVIGLAAVGAWRVVRERRASAIALLIGWPLVDWVFVSGIPYENPRFIWPALPSVAGLAGIGFVWLRGHLASRDRGVLAVGLAASLALGLLFAGREHARTVARKNADRAVVAWLDAAVPRSATVWRAGGTLMAETYGATKIRDVYRAKPDQIPGLLASDGPSYYLEDRDDIEGQWAGLPPDVFFESLRRAPGLTAVASRPPFTLFRIEPLAP